MQSRTSVALLLTASLWLIGTTQAMAQGETVPQTGNDLDRLERLRQKALPEGVILVKGAVPSASDGKTPLPEQGNISSGAYHNRYFGLTYAIPEDWTEKYTGPPPSDSGSYVLLQLEPAKSFKGPMKGTILVTAQDLFFSLTPGSNALEAVQYSKDTLPSYYQLERPPTEVTIAGRSFARFDYGSQAAQLHWSVLAAQIRCHVIRFVFNSRDTELIERLIQDMSRAELPAGAGARAGNGGGEVPVCVADYATGENIVQKVDPVLYDRAVNPIPARIIIDETGKVKHIHLISAFSDQSKAITDALLQWRFKPYKQNGHPAPVETGIMFGLGPRRLKTGPAAGGAAIARE